jgi:hypothetical protein
VVQNNWTEDQRPSGTVTADHENFQGFFQGRRCDIDISSVDGGLWGSAAKPMAGEFNNKSQAG